MDPDPDDPDPDDPDQPHFGKGPGPLVRVFLKMGSVVVRGEGFGVILKVG